MRLRIATFNLENLDDKPGRVPALADRIAVLRPEFARLDADVLCLQEVNAQGEPGEGRRLAALERLLDGTAYADFHAVATTSESGHYPRDLHNLVILSRFPILERHQYMHDLVPPPAHLAVTAEPAATAAEAVEWNRPLLHATLDIGGPVPLEVVNLHLKAPLSAPVEGQKESAFVWKTVAGWAEGYFLAALKRSGQALEARLIVERLFDAEPDALIAVCGDFNAESSEVPLTILRGEVEETGNPRLARRVMVPLEQNIPAPARFTVKHGGELKMLDHILVSRPLLSFFHAAEVHNELVADELVAFRTGRADPDSFHAPVVAEFELPES
jgi:endonuclease/exonuclease/phosphatase family metal-dependent hydrolase